MEQYEHNKHYDKILSWLSERGVIPPAKEDLSGFGLINDNVAGFLFSSDSSVAWIDVLIAKKGLSREIKEKEFRDLFLGLEQHAKNNGHKYIQVSVKSPMLMDALSAREFICDGEYKLFVKGLEK